MPEDPILEPDPEEAAAAESGGPSLSLPAKAFFGITVLLGAMVLVSGATSFASADPARFWTYLALAVLASALRVGVPNISGMLSLNFFFVLIGVAELSLPETLAMGCSALLVHLLWRPAQRPRSSQVIFEVCSTSIAIWGADLVSHTRYFDQAWLNPLASLTLGSASLFVMNTLPVALLSAERARRPFRSVWRETYYWAAPYYLAGGLAAGVIALANHTIGWRISLFIFPAAYLLFRSYSLYVGRLTDEKKHLGDIASLHLRTIEALALAIEAKDNTTHQHLRRVQLYAAEIGREMGLESAEIEALRAASLLHDIGKLAVPEHIISKPGRLTPEEFDKMKIHPVVGAGILDRVQFPYPVVPIVLAHHERWNGSGYPAGLKGDQIPIGARILAAVDTLDALASDRQYRKALPLEEAMQRVAEEAGRSFDPKVVEILERRYAALERMAQSAQIADPKLTTDVPIEGEAAPAAGYVDEHPAPEGAPPRPLDFLNLIAAARQEAQGVFELAQELGNSLSLDETLSVLAMRVQRIIPYNAMAIYVIRGDRLVPQYVTGDNFRVFAGLDMPVGGGLSGWVAETRKPLINGNPTVEAGYPTEPGENRVLCSALSVPLEGVNGIVGVLTLYHERKDAFTRDHLRVLLAVSLKIALSIENALRFRQAEDSATTDYLTGLPNARSLFLHLDAELARCKREHTALGVLVCDLNGFKQINDRYGHLEGNQVLKTVADRLQGSLREYDCVARMGGDEFVLVLPGMTPETVQPTLTRLAKSVESGANGPFAERLLSVSIGTAHYPEDGEDAETLLAEADRRMYKIKEKRRAPSGGGPAPGPERIAAASSPPAAGL